MNAAYDIEMTLGGDHRTYRIVVPASPESEGEAVNAAFRRWERDGLGSGGGVAWAAHRIPKGFYSEEG